VKIGLLSDSHRKAGKTRKAVDLLLKEGARFLLHAGDIVEEESLQILRESGVPTKTVLGNNDGPLREVMDRYDLFSEPLRFTLEELRFKMMHHPYHFMPLEEDVIIFGHTHQVLSSFNGKNLYLNPGEVCGRDTGKSSCMLLETTAEAFRVQTFFRYNGDNVWHNEEVEFARK